MKEKIKRTKEIKLRLTEAEHQRLSTLAGEIPLAEWVREFALSAAQTDIYDHLERQKKKLEQKQKQVARISVDPELLRVLAGIGNNINQVARSLNISIKQSHSGNIDLAAIALELASINKALDAIWIRSKKGDL